MVSIYGDWLNSQVTLTVKDSRVGSALGVARMDDQKNLAVVGMELEKCLVDLGGGSLGLKCKAGGAFLDNCIGYEAEAAVSYMLRVSSRGYGFLRGGYRCSQLEKEENGRKSKTTLEGAFVEVAFLL
jgi:hypothetical protein